MSEDSSADPMVGAEKAMAAIEIVVRTLGPLPSGERQKVIRASLVILGEAAPGQAGTDKSQDSIDDLEGGQISSRGRLWMKQNQISLEELQHVFDITDGVATVIASEVSGKNNAEKTIKAYSLAGVARLLTSGEAAFDDKEARNLCEVLGCYDSTNHSKYMKEMGNNFAGSKEKGWKLTAPGLRTAAALVKNVAGS